MSDVLCIAVDSSHTGYRFRMEIMLGLEDRTFYSSAILITDAECCPRFLSSYATKVVDGLTTVSPYDSFHFCDIIPRLTSGPWHLGNIINDELIS